MSVPLDVEILDRLGEGVCVVAPDGQVRYANPLALGILEVLGLDDLEGLTAADLRGVDVEGRPVARRDLPVAVTRRCGEELSQVEVGFPDLAGDVRYLRISTRALGGEAPYGVVASFSDVTEARRITEELDRERRRLEDRLRELAERDGLTGLLNRRRFDEELERLVARCARSGEPVALAVLDLDGFKAVNDQRGHAAGDAVLQAVARALEGRARSGDVVARLGGDEFAVLLHGVHADLAAFVAESYRDAVRAAVGAEGVDASIGTTAVRAGDTPDRVLARADRAMYDVKAARPARSSVRR